MGDDDTDINLLQQLHELEAAGCRSVGVSFFLRLDPAKAVGFPVGFPLIFTR